MAYTQEQLDALEAALAKGEKRVSFGDKSVEYRTVEELRLAIRVIEKGLAEQATATGLIAPSPRQIRITTNKGL